MHKDIAIILIIIYLLVIYLLSKYFKIKKRISYMQEAEAICTDIVVRRTYNKKYYLYFYKYTFKKEEYTISDKLRLPIFQKQIKIKDKYLMYFNPQNNDDYLTPIQVLSFKWYLYISLTLIIISLLLFV